MIRATDRSDTALKPLYRRKVFGGRFILFALSALLLIASHGNAEAPNNKGVSLNNTPSQYKPYAIALGQRLQRPGKERIIATGSLLYDADGPESAFPVEIVWQHPLKVRLTQDGSSVVYDRSNPAREIPESKRLSDTLQVLLEDMSEGFLSLQSTGSSRRIGSGFRLRNSDPGDTGADIIQMTYPNVFGGGEPVVKTYVFNSRTKLLGVVSYISKSGSAVDVIIDDWRDIQGEKVPFLIERWEDGIRTMQLKLSSAAVTEGSNDDMVGGN
ncbi:MAG: hypothetical protein QUT30_07580 [Acidobacteriota bacterium]|nr:hypothetical protein [Acidobacteriota bacterium]